MSFPATLWARSSSGCCVWAETCDGSGHCVGGAPPVVDDGNLVTSRTWHDNTHFMREFIKLLDATR